MKNNDWQNFLQSCAKLKTTQQFADFFSLLLTYAERQDIAARYKILIELLAGKKTQRAIAKELNLSIAKITRGSNALKTVDKKTLNLIQAISK